MKTDSTRRASLPKFTDRLTLGQDGLRISPFCLGMVRSPAAVAAAFDRGINFFFVSADMHWPLYAALRQGLSDLLARGKRIRDEIVVGVVCYATQPEFCWMPFQEVLDEIPGLGTIDLLIAGGAYPAELEARLPVYEEHRRQRYLGGGAIGVTFHARSAALAAVNQNLLDIAFVRYNPEHPGASTDLFPHLQRQGRTLILGFNSTRGFLTPSRLESLGIKHGVYWHPAATDYYRFALSQAELDGLLVGPGTPAEIVALETALGQGPLAEEEERYLLDLSLLSNGKAELVSEEGGLQSPTGFESRRGTPTK